MAEDMMDVERMGLNKWQMHRALQKLNVASVRVPATRVATRRTILKLLNCYDQVYIKPVGTWGGTQIARITREGTGAITLFNPSRHPKMIVKSGAAKPHVSKSRRIHSSGQPQNSTYLWEQQGLPTITFTTLTQLLHHFISTYAGIQCIVQAAAPVLDFHGRPFDIRLLMQRDSEDLWVAAGSVVRVGGTRSIVSNVGISNGEVLDLRTLCTELKIRPSHRVQLEQRLEHTGFAICTLLEEYRHFNEIGIDFGLAKNRKLWIFEVNTDDAVGGPSHELFAQLPDSKVYDDIEARAARVRLETVRLLFEEFFGSESTQ